jgi:hypothetical protein
MKRPPISISHKRYNAHTCLRRSQCAVRDTGSVFTLHAVPSLGSQACVYNTTSVSIGILVYNPPSNKLMQTDFT